MIETAKGPAVTSFESEKQRLKTLLALREWVVSLAWPEYVGSIHMSWYSGLIGVYPKDAELGFPEHFQTQAIRSLPITGGKLKRVFSEKDGTITWDGYLDHEKIPDALKEALASEFWTVGVYFSCGTKTNCKLTSKKVTKKVTETVWDIDCSGEPEEKEVAVV